MAFVGLLFKNVDQVLCLINQDFGVLFFAIDLSCLCMLDTNSSDVWFVNNFFPSHGLIVSFAVQKLFTLM